MFIKKGGVISRGPKKQQTTALSTCEAEYRNCFGFGVLEQKIFEKCLKPVTQFCDNQSAIQLVQNESHQAETKHIDVRHHFI